MYERYFVTYKSFSGGQVVPTTGALGRFRDLKEAGDSAKRKYSQGEVLSVRKETRLEAAWHKVARVLVRSLRVACAAVLAFVTYSWISTTAPDTGDVPLSQFTGNMIGLNLFYAVVGIGIFWACMALAFGDGPEDSPFN